MTHSEFRLAYARKFVVDHLNWQGPLHSILTPAQMWHAYCLCDGFDMPPAELAEYGWDWSHVRDSRPETYLAVADYIAGETWHLKTFAAIVDNMLAQCERVGISPETILETA